MSVEPAERRRRPKDRKEQIIAEARVLFVELGYLNTSMTAIAARVGITAGALYRHYGNKQALLQAVMRRSFVDIQPEIAGADLEELLERTSRASVERPELGVLWTREARHLSDEVRGEIRGILRASELTVAEALRSARPSLSDEQVNVLAWAVQFVLASAGRSTFPLEGAKLAKVLTSAASALTSVDLTDDGQAPPVPSATATPRSPVSRRECLLQAAHDLFTERGYQETSMADVGASAGVTGQNLYGYFLGKDALLRAVVDRAFQALWIDLGHALREDGPPMSLLAHTVNGYVGVAAGLMSVVQDSGVAGLDVDVAARQREYTAEWSRLLREARPGLSAAEAATLAQVCMLVLDDLRRTPHLVERWTFRSDLLRIGLGLLEAPTG